MDEIDPKAWEIACGLADLPLADQLEMVEMFEFMFENDPALLAALAEVRRTLKKRAH